jgi:hypothetical protein
MQEARDYVMGFLILQVVLVLILAATLCVVVWRLAKAGGEVVIVLPIICVKWGKK